MADNKSLIVIELENEDSIPRVFYEGEEINRKVRILFEWETKTDKPGKMNLEVKHYGESISDFKTIKLSKNDDSICPECGFDLDTKTWIADKKVVFEEHKCKNCGYKRHNDVSER